MCELERRDTPAWWSVTAPIPGEGTAGVTDATHTGQLTFAPDVTPTNGVAAVWADTVAHAAAKALVGTVTVTLLGQSVEHTFGPDSVGTAVADHKAFLAVASGSSVSLVFKDMAGQPGCDYDYNDRSWGGVSVAGSANPVVAVHEELWGPAGILGTEDSVSIRQTVTRFSETEYEWDEEFTNLSTSISNPLSLYNLGVGFFEAGVPDLADVTRAETPPGWATSQLDPTPNMNLPAMRWDGGPLMPGDSVTFKYFTPPRPVGHSSGYSGTPPHPDGGTGANGFWVLAPVKATADITIDGDLTVGATNPNIPGSKGVVTEFSPKNDTNEDNPGGLVVMNSNSNNAPRQQITIQKLKDAVGNPAVGGQVEVTWAGGRVELYDAATGGNKVPTGTVYNNVAGVLPKQLWVQGVEGGAGGARQRDDAGRENQGHAGR